MEILLLLLVGVLYSAGIFLMLRRSKVKLVLGSILIANGVNVLIFLTGGLTRGKPPIINEAEPTFTDIYADPVPQALILAAIVISFALTAFAIILLKNVYETTGSVDLDSLNVEDLDI